MATEFLQNQSQQCVAGSVWVRFCLIKPRRCTGTPRAGVHAPRTSSKACRVLGQRVLPRLSEGEEGF